MHETTSLGGPAPDGPERDPQPGIASAESGTPRRRLGDIWESEPMRRRDRADDRGALKGTTRSGRHRALEQPRGPVRASAGPTLLPPYAPHYRPPAPVPWRTQRRQDVIRRYQEICRHLTLPLFRNAYALMVNTGATGVLGILYWLLAARHYSAVDVGRASAAYAAMNLLAGFTAFNLVGAITRFVPQAGKRTAAFVLRAYLFSSVVSVVVATVVLLTVRHWGASYVELRGVLPGVFFVACVVAWGIFTLQDGVLTGLRSAMWVPLENGLFGIIKIVLLLALAAALPVAGIEVSWMLPVIVSLPLINLLIFGKLMPSHVRLTGDRLPPTRRQVASFLAGDYTGALCLLATTSLVPIAVAIRIGPGLNAYFYIAWTIGGVLDLLAINMATSLTVEGAFDSAMLAANCRAALRRTMLLLVPVAVTVALLAPIGLGLFGRHYAAYGAPILVLLAIATLPKALTELYLGTLRAQSRTKLIAVIQVLRAVLILGLALALTGTIGIVGAGVAVLASQTAIALIIAPGLRRVLIAGRATPGPADLEGENLVSVQEQGLAAAAGMTMPPQHRGRVPAWLPVASLSVLAAAGLVLFVTSLSSVTARLGQMNGLGLVSVLPVRALAGVTLIALAFLLALGLSRHWRGVLGVMLVAIVVCLDGVTAIAEPDPRFPTAYWISGFVDYVSRTGHTAPGLSAYFSWPGFFDVVALVEHGVGSQNLMPVLRFWPMAIDLACLVPLGMILLRLRASWRARWFAALVFTVGNWVGQDYFSPQSFNFLLYLLFIALLLTWFGRSGAPRAQAARSAANHPPERFRDEPTVQMERVSWDTARRADRLWPGIPRWISPASSWLGRAWLRSPQTADWRPWPAPRWLARLIRPFRGRLYRRPADGVPRWKAVVTRPIPGDLPARITTSSQRAGMLAVLIAVGAFSTVSHQLTPFNMLAVCAGLVVVHRCRLAGLPVLLAVIFAGWLSFGAIDYWSGHLSSIFGGLGNLGSNVSTSVSGRMVGSTPLHVLVLYSRSGFALAALILAVVGLWRRRRLGIDDRVAVVLLCVPFLGFGLQSYGGEIALRVYMFALPGIAILAAFLFFPNPVAGRRVWRAVPAAAACIVAAVLVFFVARYGNEAFEQTPPGEVAAMNYLYAHDGQGIRVAWLSEAPSVDDTPQMPWQYKDIEKINYVPETAPANPASVSGLVGDLQAMGPGSYLITTSTQEAYLQQAGSYPAGWGQAFRADMRAFPGVRVVYSNSSAVIYTLRYPPGAPRQSMPSAAASPTRSTIWTPIGLVVLVLLVLVLAGREFARVWWTDSRRLVRRLTLTSLPLLLLFVVIVILRFVVLA